MYGPTLPLDWMEEEFKFLSERIILLKILYYYPEKISKKAHKLATNDDAYDEFEKGYLRLCRELNRPNTLVHKEYPDYKDISDEGMFEVDFNREDVKIVLGKYQKE